jgi:hypothetical protein
MELNTISLGDFVKLADVIWGKSKMSVPQYARTSGIFKETPISANSGNTREFSEIDLEEYASYKGQSDQAERASVQQGYTKTMTSYRVAKDIGISYEMRTQNKYPEVTAKLTGLGKMGPNRLDLDLSHRITFCTATSYVDMDGRTIATTTGDGFQLAYTAHTLAGSATTFRNRLAGNAQLSKGSLENMEKLIVEETYNQFGEKMTMNFDILFTADDPNTVNMAKQLLKSSSDTTQNNSGVINPQIGSYKHVILPRLATDKVGAPDTDKRKYWGLVSSEMSTAYLGVWEEAHLKTPAALNAGEEFATDDWNFGLRMGYGIVIVSASWFKFSDGLGTA